MTNSKKKKWVRFRHRVVRNLLSAVIGPYSRIKYGIRVERFREQGKRPYLILLNHQTPFDQFFVGLAFKGPIYYLATEDIFSKGLVSSLIRYLVAPIPIKKQTADVRAIMNCIKVASEGGAISIAPEGNRTYSGRTEYMNPTIAPLARKLGMPIALFRIEGGYGVQPRWSDVVRKGKMRAYVSRVISPEEYAEMSNDELFLAIKDGLYVNEAVADGEFRHKKCAEYLERAIYTCPFCGLSELESSKDTIRCTRCDRKVKYLPTKELSGIGFDFPFRFVSEWYDHQIDLINGLDVTKLTEEPIYVDKGDIKEVIPYKKKISLASNATLSLFGDRIEIRGNGYETCVSFDTAGAVTVLGRNKLNLYHGEKIIQVKGSKRFSALKYVHVYHRYKNILRGQANEQFLGL